MQNINKLHVIKQSFIFSRLNDEELVELAALASERSLAPGEFVFWDGDAPDWFYIVAEGQVKALKHSSSGKEFIIAFFGPGEMFGEVAVFENKPYPASAQAVSETRVLGIKREDFLSFLKNRPQVALRIINVLGGRLRDAQARSRDLAVERVEQRIARTLLMLSAKLGTTLPFTRQEIADMSGTTTETAIRVMSRLKEGGIIRSVRGKTVILDELKLRLLSEGPPQV
ncbi:MAG TPA: Crp/Fnr family transcriptional regulator [Dehalococcoidia bacterium]|nr:Crp/Fnr family transcriptional regulator [Dehalococcoidia bacterium]